MRRISPLSTRVPVRVALPVARVAVRRVQGGGPGAQSVPPRPRPSRASPSRCGSDPLKATRHIQASAQAVGRAGCPRHPYSHSESNCGPPSSIYPTLGGVSICSASYMAKKNNGLQT